MIPCFKDDEKKARLEKEFQTASQHKVVVAVTEASIEASYQLFSNMIITGYYALKGLFFYTFNSFSINPFLTGGGGSKPPPLRLFLI